MTCARADGSPFAGKGTGFLVAEQDATGKHAFFLVTNRHVVDPSYADPRFVGASIRSVRIDGYRVDAGGVVVPTAAEWAVQPDFVFWPKAAGEDVALVPTTSVTNLTAAQPQTLYTTQVLATQAEFGEDISVGDFVVMCGYPKLAGVQVEEPLLLPGVVSSDPSRLRPHPQKVGDGRLFLLHAFSRQGLSGAPVFATQRGIAMGDGLAGPQHRVARLVGVNAGHWPGDEDGPAAFSYAVRSDVLLELVSTWRHLRTAAAAMTAHDGATPDN